MKTGEIFACRRAAFPPVWFLSETRRKNFIEYSCELVNWFLDSVLRSSIYAKTRITLEGEFAMVSTPASFCQFLIPHERTPIRVPLPPPR
jgi:hypothetical protein